MYASLYRVRCMNESMLKDVAEWGVVYTMKMSTRRPISSYVCM
jgi:hypothetical protein